MTDQIEKFDINAAAEKLKLQIRSAFMELLTPEQFKEMVSVELKRFLEPSSEYSAYQAKTIQTPSAFSKLCTEVFGEYVKEEIKQTLASPEWQAQWGQESRPKISAAIKDWLTANSQKIIESQLIALAGQAAQSLVENLRYR
jgi:hypothetical protein